VVDLAATFSPSTYDEEMGSCYEFHLQPAGAWRRRSYVWVLSFVFIGSGGRAFKQLVFHECTEPFSRAVS